MKTKIFVWYPDIGFGYKIILILAHSKEEAINLVQSEQDKYEKAYKEIKDYEKEIGWIYPKCGHDPKSCNCQNKVTPQLRKIWDKGFRLANYEDELKYMNEKEPILIKNLETSQILEIGGYEE